MDLRDAGGGARSSLGGESVQQSGRERYGFYAGLLSFHESCGTLWGEKTGEVCVKKDGTGL